MRKRLCALLAFLCLFSVTVSALAHNGAARFVDAHVHDGGVSLTVRSKAADAAVANGIGATMTAEALDARRDLVRAWLIRGIEVSADEPCALVAAQPQMTEGSVSVALEATCGDGPLTIQDATVGDGHQTIVTAAESDAPLILNSPADVAALSRPVTTLEAAATFVVQGALHLVTGYDHMLFVLSLLFAAGLVSREHGTRRALRSVAWIITAFTIGHSITLVVASVGWVSLPSWIVEATIAASIIVVAAMNIFRAEATMDRATIAFGFGLIHGFGFSSVLADVGLPADQHVVALLSFNVGIELAQLAFVALALGPIAWLARQRFYRRAVMQGGSFAIAICAAYWLVERVLGA